MWLWKLSIIGLIIVYNCSVPNYFTGSSQDQSSEKISVHKIPTDHSILNEWMNAIPREDWTPSCHSINSVLSSFHEEDFVTNTWDSDDRKKRKREDSSVRRNLKRNAIPSIFPGLPSYLSKKKVDNWSNTTSSTARLKAENLRNQKAIDSLMISTQVNSSDELQQKMNFKILPEGVNIFEYQDELVYVYFELDQQRGVTALFSISVYQNLTFDTFMRGNRLSCKHVSHLVGDKILDACTTTQQSTHSCSMLTMDTLNFMTQQTSSK